MPAKEKKISKQDALFLMTPLRQSETRLNHIIWLCVKPSEKDIASIKVQTQTGDRVQPYEWISLSVEEQPKILEKNATVDPNDFDMLKNFIRINKTIILSHWNMEIDTAELLRRLSGRGTR